VESVSLRLRGTVGWERATHPISVEKPSLFDSRLFHLCSGFRRSRVPLSARGEGPTPLSGQRARWPYFSSANSLEGDDIPMLLSRRAHRAMGCSAACLDQSVIDAPRSWDPWSSAGRRHDLFASALVAQRDGDVDGYGSAVLAQRGTAKLTGVDGRGASHAASCCEPPLVRSSLQRDVSPSIRRHRSMPSG